MYSYSLSLFYHIFTSFIYIFKVFFLLDFFIILIVFFSLGFLNFKEFNTVQSFKPCTHMKFVLTLLHQTKK
jgi:hypothetical protein